MPSSSDHDPIAAEDRCRLSVEIKTTQLEKLEQLRCEWGLPSRGDVLSRLLDEIFADAEA